jgi:hypothetical protein
MFGAEMSDLECRRLGVGAAIESGREVAEESPSSGMTLPDDDLERVAAAGSNSIRYGQETN